MSARPKMVKGVGKKRNAIAIAIALAGGVLAGCVADPPKPETATVATAVKTPATKTVTNFTPALRCMDELMQGHGVRDIVITAGGLPDSTGKVGVGTKDMLISAISKMTVKSKALTFIDYGQDEEMQNLITELVTNQRLNYTPPKYYIRGAITQLDENAIDAQQGGGIALPFMDLGLSRDQVSSVVSVDLNLINAETRSLVPGISSTNSLVITRSGKGADLGGKLGKAGFSFNVSLNKSEGLGSGVRALIELGTIELIGKLTNTPYWKCLEIEKTNPVMIEQAREWYDAMSPTDRVKLVQRKLSGMNRYQGPIDGVTNKDLTSAIGKFQAENGLIADGRINFELYYALLDNDQPMSKDDTASNTAQMAINLPSPASAPLTVKIDSGRGPSPVYKQNELLQANIQLSGDGTLYCYYREVNGKISRVFPNRFHSSPYIRKGETISLPPKGGFDIILDHAGQEEISCYASIKDISLTLPENLKKVDLAPLPVASLDEIASAFRRTDPNLAEAKLPITVR